MHQAFDQLFSICYKVKIINSMTLDILHKMSVDYKKSPTVIGKGEALITRFTLATCSDTYI